MARPFEEISCINPSKELWKIVVRVQHKWPVVSGNKEHCELVVVDTSVRHSSVTVSLTPMGLTYMPLFLRRISWISKRFWRSVIHTLSNFKVECNDLLFRPSSHKYLIKFNGGTSCGDIDKHIIPAKKNVFTSFADIMIGKYNKDILIDVIGMVDSIGYAQINAGSKKQQINFVLRDNVNNTMNCTLWESYASEFIKYHQDKDNHTGPMVVLLEYAKVKEEGKYSLAVTNTYNVTKLSINSDVPPINEFRISIPKETVVNVSGQLSANSNVNSQQSENSQQSPFEKLLSKSVVLPLTEIIKLREVSFCSTVATTKKLIASQYGWYYKACHECPKVARGKSPPFTCDSGHSTETAIFRYKIEIEVSHLDGCCKFVFWDRECTELLGVSAAQMRDTMINVGVTDPLEFPLALDSMLGLEIAYKVKWQPRWDSCSVVMIVRDTDVIKQLKGPWEPKMAARSPECVAPQLKQIRESVDDANSEGIESCEIIPELEITSKHRPEPTTPDSKRKTQGGSTESGTSPDFPDGSLSTTKLKKLIKSEPKD